MKYNNAIISPSAPRMGNALTRAVGSALLRLFGWKVEGQLPDETKVILVGEPHTSNWDFILIMCAAQSVGFRMSYIMKKEAFFWPLGGFFKWMGGLPIERKKGQDSLSQIAAHIQATDRIFLAITPSGSRSANDKYKTGYLRLATNLDIPLFLIGLNAPSKSIILDQLVDAADNINAQNKSIKDYMDRNYTGIKPDNQRTGPLTDGPPDNLIGARQKHIAN